MQKKENGKIKMQNNRKISIYIGEKLYGKKSQKIFSLLNKLCKNGSKSKRK